MVSKAKNKNKVKVRHDFKWWRNRIARFAIYFVLICVGFAQKFVTEQLKGSFQRAEGGTYTA